MRRTPLLSFVAFALLLLGAFNEANLHHWGTMIVLLVVALGTLAIGLYTLRQ